jgi:hypothetical protein
MLRTIVVALAATEAAAGSIELVSGNLGGANRALDNIKGKWSQGLKLFGRDTTVSAEYDRNSNKDFLSEVSLSGSSGKVDYELTNKFGGATDYKLSTKTSDGTTLEAEGSVDADISSGLKDVSVSKVSASRSVSLSGISMNGVSPQDCDLELSHDLSSSESKLKLSTVLGSGVKAIGLMSTKGGDSKMSYEVEYDATLSDGRTLSASVSPADGTGEVEYEDSATLDATVTAKFPLGGTPSVTIKRSFGF